jgi:hypothetical protein
MGAEAPAAECAGALAPTRQLVLSGACIGDILLLEHSVTSRRSLCRRLRLSSGALLTTAGAPATVMQYDTLHNIPSLHMLRLLAIGHVRRHLSAITH